jgi:integrase
LASAVERIGGGSENGRVLGYGLLVRLLALYGLRWSEVSGLRVGDIDFAKRRLHVKHTVVEVGGLQHVEAPKSYEARSVPVPRRLLEELEATVRERSKSEPLFPSARSHSWLRNRAFRRGWLDAAAEEIGGPGLTPHELRHTAASLAISAGAHVKAVQRMLGHASAAVTLDTYSDLFDDDLDDVADRLDQAATRAAVSKPRPRPERGGAPE